MNSDTAADDESWWKRTNVRVDTINKIVSPLGILTALVLAVFSVRAFYLQRGTLLRQGGEYDRQTALVDLRIERFAVPMDSDRYLLTVDIILDNVGKHAVRTYAHSTDPKEDKEYSGEGLTLSVTRHDGATVGRVADSGERIINRFNILEKYDYNDLGSWARRYAIPPGTEYRETEAFVLNKPGIYEVVSRFYGRQDKDSWATSVSKFVYVGSKE